jgi:hypothetical protein
VNAHLDGPNGIGFSQEFLVFIPNLLNLTAQLMLPKICGAILFARPTIELWSNLADILSGS